MVHAGLDREEASYLKDVAVATVAASTSLLGPRGGATQAANVATQRDVSDYFQQNRKYWSSEPQTYSGNKVYQRNELIDPNLVSEWTIRGKVVRGTNLERMASGRAPIGHDGNSINLHHMTQRQSGAIAEMTQSFHKGNHGVIHINPNTIPSGINRAKFKTWSRNYWKDRASNWGK
ncbi:HNH/ENDO VII family nuclease [Halomonas binhaiensis]|uniref:HNH/ENDO VII family nuclease n=1 Tax=Halomonas binhaiensis TaxID=2562282 RepID=A0A7U3K5R3_9GAMM|nr:HNH/ENDO VII family nuclease [Halomonas binhaiensis]QRG26802.1 HNH/ENDO VII family nuclease [Halomonas binhaiensis]